MKFTVDELYDALMARVGAVRSEEHKDYDMKVIQEIASQNEAKIKAKKAHSGDLYRPELERLVAQFMKTNNQQSEQEVFDALKSHSQFQRGWTIDHVKRIFTKRSTKYWQRDGLWSLRGPIPLKSA